MLRASPRCIHVVLPCESSGDVGRRLRPSDEDKLQATADIVGLKGAADRRSDLEGFLAEGDRGEGDIGGRDQADRLGGLWLASS